jgi:hypothetical protein
MRRKIASLGNNRFGATNLHFAQHYCWVYDHVKVDFEFCHPLHQSSARSELVGGIDSQYQLNDAVSGFDFDLCTQHARHIPEGFQQVWLYPPWRMPTREHYMPCYQAHALFCISFHATYSGGHPRMSTEPKDKRIGHHVRRTFPAMRVGETSHIFSICCASKAAGII